MTLGQYPFLFRNVAWYKPVSVHDILCNIELESASRYNKAICCGSESVKVLT